MRRSKLARIGAQAGAYAVLIPLSLLAIMPFVWALSASLKSSGQVFTWPPQLIPAHPQWHNYADVLKAIPFFTLLRNTAFYAVCVTSAQILFCSMAGYVFARLKFPGRDALFLIYMATLMIPAQVTIIPNFVLMKWLGWVNTGWSMTIPGMTGGAFGTFLMRQAFLTLPRELDEAAVIDGATTVQIYWKVLLPLVRPAITVLAVLTWVYVWNDFYWPFVMLRDPEVSTLTLGLISFQGQHYTNWPVLMAASTMVVAPLLVIYLFAQKAFIKGIAATGLGGR